jgi:PKD repeat protein
MYLDTNGDGVNDTSDQIDANGPTTVDIWVNTAANRDGSPVACDVSATTPLTINSWEIVLQAVGGTLEWGSLQNLLAISPGRANFASAGDTTDPVWYHNGWGGYYILPAGLYHVGQMRVTVLTGHPAIAIVPFKPSQPTDLTSFGTNCPGRDDDNTYKLGFDWTDVAGIGGGIIADAGGPYLSSPSIPIQFTSSATLNPPGRPLAYAWDFGDGAGGSGPSPSHAFGADGEYRVTLSISDGESTSETWTIAKIIDRTPPVARAGGPYAGAPGYSVFFDGRSSSDANGDALTYSWLFGDATGSRGEYAYHTYYAPGVYTVTLLVNDGVFTSSDTTHTSIRSTPENPPIAIAGGPYEGYVGVRLQLDGQRSSDPDGDNLTFRWMFGDGAVSNVASPQHVYVDVGEYEVILEVNDGTIVASDVTSATIQQPTGSPPTVEAGGPYRVITRQSVLLDGSASADPDRDALSYNWNFGDQTHGTGATAAHSYVLPGVYGVTLTVSDGIYIVDAHTQVTVADAGGPGQARAFVPVGSGSIAVGAGGSSLVVQIEPIERAFRLVDVDLSSVNLRCAGTRVEDGILAANPASIGSDSDGNGVPELTAAFKPEDLRRLLGRFVRPTAASLELEASTWQGGVYKANLKVEVLPSGSHFAAVVRPNPFNPTATISFAMSKPGRVHAELFDVNGRLAKAVIRDVEMDAGSHDLSLETRGENGSVLSSGIYFLRIDGPDGTTVTRVTIAK